MSAERIAILACSVCVGGIAIAAEEEAVDTAFLEYLGEWDEADDDWLLFDEADQAAAGEREKPEKEEAESPEKDDAS